jgi:hypothetical protein
MEKSPPKKKNRTIGMFRLVSSYIISFSSLALLLSPSYHLGHRFSCQLLCCPIRHFTYLKHNISSCLLSLLNAIRFYLSTLIYPRAIYCITYRSSRDLWIWLLSCLLKWTSTRIYAVIVVSFLFSYATHWRDRSSLSITFWGKSRRILLPRNMCVASLSDIEN